MCVQSALVVQATHLPAEQRAAAGLGQLVLTTHSQPPLATPSQFESSPGTVQESAASGPTEPVHAPSTLLELPLGPGPQTARPAWQIPLPSPG
jgi:hypothetical protein